MSQKKTEAEMDDLEYLQNSIKVFEQAIKESQDYVKYANEESERLQEDIRNIESERLKKGAMNAHNLLIKERKDHRDRIKQIRVDLAHARSIYKKLHEKVKK